MTLRVTGTEGLSKRDLFDCHCVGEVKDTQIEGNPGNRQSN